MKLIEDFDLSDTSKTILDERIATENKSDFIPVEEAHKLLRLKYGLTKSS